MVTFVDMEKAATEAYEAGFHKSAPFHAIRSAENNAHDTIEENEKVSPEDFDRIAMDTLGYLCAFNAELALFFAPLGLKF